MGEQFDDPNREAVGLAPISSGGDAAPPDAPPEAEAAEKGHKGHKGHKASEPEPERDTDAGAT